MEEWNNGQKRITADAFKRVVPECHPGRNQAAAIVVSLTSATKRAVASCQTPRILKPRG